MKIFKGTLIKSEDIVGVCFSHNKDNYLVIDGHNNILTVPKKNKIEIIKEDKRFLDTIVSVLLGLEDDRWEHQDKESKTVANNFQKDLSYSKIISKLAFELKKYNSGLDDILYIVGINQDNLIVDIGFEVSVKIND